MVTLRMEEAHQHTKPRRFDPVWKHSSEAEERDCKEVENWKDDEKIKFTSTKYIDWDVFEEGIKDEKHKIHKANRYPETV